MNNFFAELKRRHIYRVGAAYALVAWVLLQLFNNLEPILKLPDWAGTLVLVLLVGGFPVALLLAWVRELAPADGSAARLATGKIDWFLAVALVVVIALVSYQQLAPALGERTAKASISPSVSPTDGITIAVLPFANLSGDAGQEFFSDGITDEIMSALAKVRGLTVLARTSAYEYKGQNRNVRAIGQALGASYLVEGSVRKAGDEVRITAQLVQADNGASLWTENYDRELKNIFATQSDIAQAIAGELKVPLGLKEGESLVANRTGDLDTYQQYLRAKTLYRGRVIDEAITVLESAVARDPDYAPGWALLSLAYNQSPRYRGVTNNNVPLEEGRRILQTSQEKAEMAARRAVQLDARNATGYGALAKLAHDRGQWAEAEDLFKQALGLDVDDPEVLEGYAFMQASSGRSRDAFSTIERLRNLEPLVPVYTYMYAFSLRDAGKIDRAIALLEALPGPSGVMSEARGSALAEAYADAGDFGKAADALLAIRGQRFSRITIENAARLLRQGPTRSSSPDKLPVLNSELLFVYFFAGVPDRILDSPEYRFDLGLRNFDASVWGPNYASVRKGERFKTLVRNSGLPKYWRARGWPDLCHPTTNDDFECS